MCVGFGVPLLSFGVPPFPPVAPGWRWAFPFGGRRSCPPLVGWFSGPCPPPLSPVAPGWRFAPLAWPARGARWLAPVWGGLPGLCGPPVCALGVRVRFCGVSFMALSSSRVLPASRPVSSFVPAPRRGCLPPRGRVFLGGVAASAVVPVRGPVAGAVLESSSWCSGPVASPVFLSAWAPGAWLGVWFVGLPDPLRCLSAAAGSAPAGGWVASSLAPALAGAVGRRVWPAVAVGSGGRPAPGFFCGFSLRPPAAGPSRPAPGSVAS